MPNQLIIFDFDGVLVDTEYATFDFYREALKPHGIFLQESDFKLKKGRKSMDFFRDALKEKFNEAFAKDLTKMKRDKFLTDIKAYVKPIPGGFELVKQCKDAGLTLVIGSQNERELLEAAVDTYGIRQYFNTILSLQDVKNKKPDPELFLLAMQRTNIPSELAIVIEDSAHGITAGNAAGCKTIAVLSNSTKEEMTHATLIVEKIQDLTPEQLKLL